MLRRQLICSLLRIVVGVGMAPGGQHDVWFQIVA
jgi:hypothetical protein